MANRFLAPYSRGGLRSQDPLLDLHREMNRLFDDMLGFGAGFGSGGGTSTFASSPRLDMHESDQELTIEAELPGVDRNDLDLRLDGDMLTISGEKKSRRDDKRGNAHLSECSYGRFQRTVQLPFRPEPDEVQAEFEGGVLKLSMPKRPGMQGSRRIEVKGGRQEGAQVGSSGASQGAAGDRTGGQAMTSAVGGGPSQGSQDATGSSSSSSGSSATAPPRSTAGSS